MRMPDFQTRSLSAVPDEIAPDNSDVRLLVRDGTASMAHFTLEAGEIAVAVKHRTVSEYWFVVAGSGRMWRKDSENVEVVGLEPGVSLSIPLGTAFQFRNDGTVPLEIVGFDTPPWPGDDEAFAVEGQWQPTLS